MRRILIRMTDQNATVPDRVRDIAIARKVRQSDLADTIDLSRNGIVRRLNGSVRFTDEQLIRLADRLDVPVGAFFGEVPVTLSGAPVAAFPSAANLQAGAPDPSAGGAE